MSSVRGAAPSWPGRFSGLGLRPLGADVDSGVSGEVLTAARVALACERGLDHERPAALQASIANIEAVMVDGK